MRGWSCDTHPRIFDSRDGRGPVSKPDAGYRQEPGTFTTLNLYCCKQRSEVRIEN